MIKHEDELLNLIHQGAWVITPNNRLSHQLLQRAFLKKGNPVQEKPRCMPYQAFLRDRFHQARQQAPHTHHPILLTALQQRYLWKEIIREQPQYPCNEGLLHEVQEAWTRCQHWQVDAHHDAFAQTPQTRQFQLWRLAFLNKLAHLHAITEAQLVDYLLPFKDLFALKTVIWACFDDYTPEQRALQDGLTRAGCQNHDYDLINTSSNTNSSQHPAKDTEDEIVQLIHWLNTRLNAGDTRIGVVVPDLQTRYFTLQRQLQRSISPEHVDVSLGQPLSTYPLVAHTLMWLSINTHTISNHEARLLLRSPYLLGAKHEFLARQELVFNAKILQESTLSMPLLIQALRASAPKLATGLSALQDYPKEASIDEWITLFKNRLMTLGFPGEYSIKSESYQCFQRLMSLFDEFQQLTFTQLRLQKHAALETFHELAKSTIFQVQKAKKPIQLLGLLEASGCRFDSVWVTGMTSQCLPQKIKLSAFIPLDLQRNLGMPHAVVERELQFARQMIERLQQGSQHSVFSYPQFSDDMPNSPSPLIAALPHRAPGDQQKTQATSQLIPRHEPYLFPLQPSEALSGGTTLLANQAKCPFRAFAAHRLHAKPTQTISTGLNPMERGQLLHRIMEILWRQLGDQHTLLTHSPEAINALIEEAIEQTLTPFTKNRPHSCSPLVQDVEHTRLKRLIAASLEWEKQRDEFKIEALEKAFTLTLAGLDFQVRIDRLDRLASDEKWVIDYKTSLPVNKPWNEDRPEAPQLLLYALLDKTITGLLFLQLKTGRLTCNGFSESPSAIKGIMSLKKDEQWSSHQDKWHQQLTELATEFRDGICSPTPTRTSTCGMCEFQRLCRT
jgi:ATP-dependent helicase/nuclease subunit B